MRRSIPLAALLLLAHASARAATFVETSVEDVARSSHAVVRGTVVRREGRLTADGRVVTLVEVAVASVWRGQAERTVTLVVPGGVAGGIGQRVDGAASFADGEEVVVFASREGPTWTVSGHALGKYRVVGDEARPGLGGAAVLPRALARGERRVGAMSVGELERRVREAR